ncbi:MAG TPA: hypothetical protein PKY88_05440 [Anaerohalosphaeraceae bacterium]|nr:hypothetical protein [Anaerohalosphaeraceae bacterium]
MILEWSGGAQEKKLFRGISVSVFGRRLRAGLASVIDKAESVYRIGCGLAAV